MPDFASFGTAQPQQGGGATPAIATPTIPKGLPKLPGNFRMPPAARRPHVDDEPPEQHQQAAPQPTESEAAPEPETPPSEASPAPRQPSAALAGASAAQAATTGQALPPAEIRAAIVRAATAAGISPAYALATAERESSFNPNEGGTGSIAGMFQMSGGLRKKYGVGADVDSQAAGFANFTRDLRGEMKGVLRRDPTDEETYMGHHFGGTRAARMLSSIAPDTPVEHVFTPLELRLNPHLRGTSGDVVNSIRGDMTRRMARHGGQAGGAGEDFAAFGAPG